jgi:CBS domain containing-hemolysin-like protein
LGACLVAGAALALLTTAAAQAAGLFAGRSRSRSTYTRFSSRSEGTHQFALERERLVGALVFARTVSLVTGVSTSLTLVMRRTGVALEPVLLTAVIAVLVAGVIEGLPRVVVTRNPDRWQPVLLQLVNSLRLIFVVPAYLLDLPGRALLRLPAFRPADVELDDDEGLVRLVEMEESQGGIEQEEREMIRAVIELEDTTAREVMVPRIDMTAVDRSASLREVASLIAERGLSRIPVYESSIDNITGVVYAKDLLAHLARGGESDVAVATLARTPLFVPETKRLDELLRELKAQRIHIAIVVDEYGGTAGLLTIEDLVEEIVGEIEDEYDHAEPSVVRTGDNDAVVDAGENVYVLKELFDVEVEDGDFDTVGGLIIHYMGRIPAPNDAVDIAGLRLRVLSVTGRRIRKVRITRLEPSSVPQGAG